MNDVSVLSRLPDLTRSRVYVADFRVYVLVVVLTGKTGVAGVG